MQFERLRTVDGEFAVIARGKEDSFFQVIATCKDAKDAKAVKDGLALLPPERFAPGKLITVSD